MSDVKKSTYRVKGGMAIKHGDTAVPDGALIELSDAEAKPLLRWLERVKVDEPEADDSGTDAPTVPSGKGGKAGKSETKKDEPK